MASREAEKDFYRQQIYVLVVQTLVYDIIFLKQYLQWSKVYIHIHIYTYKRVYAHTHTSLYIRLFLIRFKLIEQIVPLSLFLSLSPTYDISNR